MNRILIIGAGGVGSWIAYFLKFYSNRGQLENCDITIMDNDKVKFKNLSYCALYNRKHVGKHKAKCLGKKCNFKYKLRALNSVEQLNDHDIILLAVNNDNARKIVNESNKFYIDCRSKGNEYSICVKSEETNIISHEKDSGSCQYINTLGEGSVQQGNVISAIMGCTQLFNYLRNTLKIYNRKGYL